MSSQAVTVFFSYSHEDEDLRNELAKHLKILKRSGVITDWHDRKILPGDEWDKQIKEQLNSAQIILLLVSSDFIASSYCWNIEIKRSMERHERGEARVIPVILRRCLWNKTPFGKLQALPKNGTPVMDVGTWPTWDDAFYSIAQGIQKAAQSFAKDVSEDNAQSVPQPFENAQEQYRARVKEYLLGRELTVFHEARLDYLREQLKLPEAEAQRIVSEELAPIEQARKAYRKMFKRLVDAGEEPDCATNRQELNQFRQELKLTDQEAVAIEQPFLVVLANKEIEGSERGIDYSKLRDLLKAGDWEAADDETLVLMRAVVRATGSYIRDRELQNFPCGDLRIIDRLWIKYSNGRFGLSVQKKIYAECSGNDKADMDKYEKFRLIVGWEDRNFIYNHHDVPSGHLPRFRAANDSGHRVFLSCIETCII